MPVCPAINAGLPPYNRRAPCQSSTEAAKHDEVTGLDFPRLIGFIQSNRHGTSRRVAVAVKIVKESGPGNMQDIDGRINDSDIRLMGDVEIDIIGLQAAVG